VDDPTALRGPGREAWLAQLAAAADLTLKPLRHAVRFSGEGPAGGDGNGSDCCLLIEARSSEGERMEMADLELEIYRSGEELNLMVYHLNDASAPLLWHGSHPVWMLPGSGERCARPADGAALEAFCRRLRALLSGHSIG
jgi:hypothetical protein